MMMIIVQSLYIYMKIKKKTGFINNIHPILQTIVDFLPENVKYRQMSKILMLCFENI